MTKPDFVYATYIATTPDKVWQALVDPELMRAYWGGMLKAGADTFWEAYSPDNPRVAPYNDFHVNSFCHAWSCTPSYLLRTYGDQIA